MSTHLAFGIGIPMMKQLKVTLAPGFENTTDCGTLQKVKKILRFLPGIPGGFWPRHLSVDLASIRLYIGGNTSFGPTILRL